MVDHDPILPTETLAKAHDAVDDMVAKVADLSNADSVWIMAMSSVEELTPEQQRQNLALLLTVALQRLAQIQASK